MKTLTLMLVASFLVSCTSMDTNVSTTKRKYRSVANSKPGQASIAQMVGAALSSDQLINATEKNTYLQSMPLKSIAFAIDGNGGVEVGLVYSDGGAPCMAAVQVDRVNLAPPISQSTYMGPKVISASTSCAAND